MQKVLRIAWLCLCLIVMPARDGEAKEPVTAIGLEACWSPGKQVMDQIRNDCSPLAGREFEACFIAGMRKSGASAQAVTFTESIGNLGYLAEFQKLGPVDIAFVFYPFRANENQGFLLVNGTPPVVDVDDLSLLSAERLKKDPSWRRLTKKYPALTLWQGDRSNREYPLMERTPAGEQRFVVRYRLLNGCRACELAGHARFAFNFDRKGKFTDTQFLEIEKSADKHHGADAMASDPAKAIVVQNGKTFTLSLRSNPTTGYTWELAAPLSESMLRQVEREYEGDKTGLIGAGGREIWTFQAVGTGETKIAFKYVRPWEAKAAPAKTAVFKVIVGDK